MQTKKENLINKIVKKDFNNELETILEHKKFEENVKSTLLSILYKIETAYKDIQIVKPDTLTKEEYIQKFIWIIQQHCSSIKIVRMNSESSNIPPNATFFIDKQKKLIECYPIERKILYAISKMGKKERIIKSNYFLIDTALSDFLNIGNSLDFVEPLRDFNGYSWTTLFTEIESTTHNLIYQNLRMLVGNKFLNNWIYHKETLIDYYSLFIETLSNRYGKKQSEKLIETLIIIAILLELKFSPEKIKIYKQDKKRIEEELISMQDKQKYTETITKEKTQLAKEIKEFDKILSNKDLLQNEYIKRNEKLPLDKKIFSMRVLSDIMIREREELYKKLQNLNDNLNPKNFITHKKDLEKQYKYLSILDIEDIDKEINDNVIKFQKIFLKCFSMQIDEQISKQDILSLIYQMRYYIQLPVTREKQIFEIIPEKLIKPIIQKLLSKAENEKVIQKITKDDEILYNIWKYIFKLRAIKLEDLAIKITKDKQQQYFLQIFDEDLFEEKVPMKELQGEIDLKLNKKIKIFE